MYMAFNGKENSMENVEKVRENIEVLCGRKTLKTKFGFKSDVSDRKTL